MDVSVKCVNNVCKRSEETANNSQENEKSVCKVRYTDEVGVVFLPCGHLVACVKCSLYLPVQCAAKRSL